MGKIPDRCPMCGEKVMWKKVDQSNKGFSVGKAAVGAVLLGPVGLPQVLLEEHWERRECVIIAENVGLIMNIKQKQVWGIT